MIFFLFAVLTLCLYGCDIAPKNRICPPTVCLSRDNTACVRGIFMLLIIAAHYAQYVALDGIYDTGYQMLRNYMGQSIVSLFLFYSGYGIYEAIKRKGTAYIKAMPVKRILITWVNLALAILLFLCMNAALNIRYSLSTILLAFTGWTSIGNSNWYIFAILCFYFFAWLCFSLFRRCHPAALISVTILSGVYVIVLRHFRLPQETWWYDTAFCFCAGLWYSFLKDKIENLFQQNICFYYAALCLSVLGVLIGKPYTYHLWVSELWELCFTATVVLFTMKVTVHNPILHWIGEHTFELYILQRIPMIVLKQMGINQYPYVFGILALLCVFPIAYLFGRFLKYIDGKVLNAAQEIVQP